MRKVLISAVAAALLLAVTSCGDKSSVYSGFKKTETGAYMKFYERHNEGEMPRIGDGVTLEMSQFFNDTMLFTTAGDKPLELEVQQGGFIGDVPDALRAMHVGDSARLVVLSDSVFTKVMQVDLPDEYLGKPIYYELKLLSIKPMEVIQAERKALLDSLKMVENNYLEGLKADPNNTLTESGLIVMEKTGNGKLAKMGDYLEFDMILSSIDGDTMINTFDVEPVNIQYGDEFICKGFNEALGMVPEGGSMRFVIPSELGFDSTGFNHYIKPYAPLLVNIKMKEVMEQAAWDAKLAQIQAEEDAKKEVLKQQESQLIENYIKENNIVVEPTETGVYLIPIEEGEGELAKWGDKVYVHYTLSNLKGELVESSYDYDSPMSFTVGQGEMIAAIEEAIMTMAPGAKVRIVTPSAQAFGEIAIDEEKLPAYSPLMIELELISKE